MPWLLSMSGSSGSESGDSNDADDEDLRRMMRDLLPLPMTGGGGGAPSDYAVLGELAGDAATLQKGKFDGAISDVLHRSAMFNDDDEVGDGPTGSVLSVVRPIMRVVLFLRGSFVKPLLQVIPEWVILIYLVGRNVFVGLIAVRVKRAAMGAEASALGADDWAFVNVYSACAVVFSVFSMLFFVLLSDRVVSEAILATLLSLIGVWASVVLDRVLRVADSAAVTADEAQVPATERRLLYLHGGAGLAIAGMLMAIPSVCPNLLSS